MPKGYLALGVPGQGKSVFDKQIFEKEKLVFVMEDSERNKFGCYINAKIDKYRYYENGKWYKRDFVFS